MPRILTLTANLLWEETFSGGPLRAGAAWRAGSCTAQAGGKGVNVARMLHRLGSPATAIVFPGGAPGAACLEWIRAQGIETAAFPAQAPTRTGVVVRAEGSPESTFLGPDCVVDGMAVDAAAQWLRARPAGETLAICGSIPGWDGPAWEPLRGALRTWVRKGRLVVDSYGPPLDWLTALPAALCKVNRTELLTLFEAGSEACPTRELLDELLQARPVGSWVVTDGPREVWIADRERPPRSLKPPAVREVSPTGSGDVLLAGILHALGSGASLDEGVIRSLPLAAANAASPGIASFAFPGL